MLARSDLELGLATLLGYDVFADLDPGRRGRLGAWAEAVSSGARRPTPGGAGAAAGERDRPRPEPARAMASKLMRCDRCDALVAMLVFAPEATDARRLEDCARLMYPQYAGRGLPTWIIGPALGPGPEDPADVLQVWPEREPIQRFTPGRFNPRIRRLAARHCR